MEVESHFQEYIRDPPLYLPEDGKRYVNELFVMI